MRKSSINMEVYIMNIGNKIKALRTKKALSQGELAEILHVSAQAVSKWESNTSYPDISQLPAIASFFGITIDELFEYPLDLEYERIETMIDNGLLVTNERFNHSEEFLLNEINKNPSNYKAISSLADLYHFYACKLNEKASHYALNALSLKPDNKNDLCTLNNASNGYVVDWNIGCHFKLIEQLYKLINNHPTNERTKLFLVDNLIADHRFEEAENILNESDFEFKPFYEVWIYECKNGFMNTQEKYQDLLDRHHDNWKMLMSVADRYAYNQEYEEAIAIYEKTFEIAPKPRYTDMLACIAYLHRILGNNDRAIQTYKRELQLLKDEWNITKGELINEIKQNIEELELN